MAYMRDATGKRLDSFAVAPKAALVGALRPVANRAAFAGYSVSSGGRSNGTDTGGNFRYQHDALAPAHGLRLVYTNTVNNAGVEARGANPIAVAASIEASSVFYPVTFNGERSITIAPGATVVSDPIGFSIGPVAATNFYTRTYVTVASAGMTWPLQLKQQGNEGALRGTTQTDLTLSGTITAGSERGYGPAAILGRAETEKPFVAIVGDSIVAGVSHFSDRSWLTQALDALGVPYINLAMASESPVRWTTNTSRALRAPMLEYVTHIICTQGVNGITQAEATLTADMRAMWAYLAATGLPVYQTTITPKVTTTDAYATLAGQSVTADESKRINLNALIRTRPAPLAGIIEAADLFESSRDSGKFKVDGTASKWTGDGIHPNSYGHTTAGTAAAPVLSAALMA